jgi:heat-inducible transcriptional repressor
MLDFSLLLALACVECQNTEPRMPDLCDLNERSRLILQAVVHCFITSAEPVGSRTIVKRFDLDLSPATVRNVMADLEEAGYLQQLHTSSGRVPTDTGYRYYVDYLMRVQELTLSERDRIDHELEKTMRDADEILKQTNHLLALVSHQTGVVEVPDASGATVRRIELLPVSPQRAAMIVVDDYGRVRSMMTELDSPLTESDISGLNRILNEHLAGAAVDSLGAAMEREMHAFVDDQRQLAERALRLVGRVVMPRSGQMFLEGTTQLFEQPEFSDFTKAREVFNILEERDRLADVLRALMSGDTSARPRVVIGSESHEAALGDISLVASPYRVGDKPVGMVGILGPRRMPYSKLSAVVEYMAGSVSRFLTRLST